MLIQLGIKPSRSKRTKWNGDENKVAETACIKWHCYYYVILIPFAFFVIQCQDGWTGRVLREGPGKGGRPSQQSAPAGHGLVGYRVVGRAAIHSLNDFGSNTWKVLLIDLISNSVFFLCSWKRFQRLNFLQNDVDFLAN